MPHIRHQINGRDIPSVTEISGFFQPKELIEWRARIGNREADRIMEEAAAIGRDFHSKVEETFLRKSKLEDTTLTGDMADLVWEWALKEGVKVIEAETPMTSSRYLVGGTPDLICSFYKSEEPVVVDYKSSSGMREGFSLQVAAYARLYNEKHGFTWENGAFRGLCVRADKTGKRKSLELKSYPDLRGPWKVFLGQRVFYEWFTKGPDLAYLLNILKEEL